MRGGISDEASSSSKASGSTSVVSPESLPAGVGAFDDYKAPKQRSKGRGSGEVGDNEGGRGNGRGSSSSMSSESTVPRVNSSTLNGEEPPRAITSHDNGSGVPMVPKIGETVNIARGRPPVSTGNKHGGSGGS